MGARGKKSASDLAIVPEQGITAIHRPGPPAELTEEQAYEWLKVTNRMPADWFPEETHGLLVQYCRHIVDARRIAQLIDAMTNGVTDTEVLIDGSGEEVPAAQFIVKEYQALLRMQGDESAKIASLATRMRISQQATLDRERKNPVVTPKPWQK